MIKASIHVVFQFQFCNSLHIHNVLYVTGCFWPFTYDFLLYYDMITR